MIRRRLGIGRGWDVSALRLPCLALPTAASEGEIMGQDFRTGQRGTGAATATRALGGQVAVRTPGSDRPTTLGRAAVLAVEARVIHALRPVSLAVLRVMLGVTFLWFGALKVLGVSPVEALVARRFHSSIRPCSSLCSGPRRWPLVRPWWPVCCCGLSCRCW